MSVRGWENSFLKLDKERFSARLIGAYNINSQISRLVSKDSTILDLGCGLGDDVVSLRSLGYLETFGTDPSRELIERAAQRGNFYRVLEDSRVPFSTASIDLVYCVGVLHHIHFDDIGTSLAEIRRVLKPTGRFLFVEPRTSLLRSLGHLVVFSRFAKFVPQLAHLQNCLINEWPTYSEWLERFPSEWEPLLRSHGFRIEAERRTLLTLLGVARVS